MRYRTRGLPNSYWRRPAQQPSWGTADDGQMHATIAQYGGHSLCHRADIDLMRPAVDQRCRRCDRIVQEGRVPYWPVAS